VLGAAGGAITALLLELRREKAQRLTIVDALIIETGENLVICKSDTIREMWFTAPHRLEAYHAYKGQLLFLPEDVRFGLIAAALNMDSYNIGMQTYVSKAAIGVLANEKPIPPPQALIEQLEFVNKELRKWREKHTR
jgi:hypothetical protein